jgi:DNA-binding LytR/AlgR family response regulator
MERAENSGLRIGSGGFSFIEFVVLEDVRARFAAGDALAILNIDLDEVIWIEAEQNYVRLHTAGKSHLVRGTLSALEKRLDLCRLGGG